MKKIIILFLLVSGYAFAGDQTGSVDKLIVSGRDYAPPYQNPAHIYLDGPYNHKPACAKSGYWAIDAETEQGESAIDNAAHGLCN